MGFLLHNSLATNKLQWKFRRFLPKRCVARQTELAEPRFIPFIQLHEFETLLYCDLQELQKRIAHSEAGINALRKEVQGSEPEEINEGANTAPSKRIIRHIPIYERNKVRVGAPALAALGLENPRAKCPHSGAWLSRLEALGSHPNPPR
jgi:hypothetical protein